MSTNYLKSTSEKNHNFAPEGTLLNLEEALARRWLKTGIIEVKQVAAYLGVDKRTIYKWINEEAAISKARAEQIIWLSKKLKAEIDKLDGETNLYLAEKYNQQAA